MMIQRVFIDGKYSTLALPDVMGSISSTIFYWMRAGSKFFNHISSEQYFHIQLSGRKIVIGYVNNHQSLPRPQLARYAVLRLALMLAFGRWRRSRTTRVHVHVGAVPTDVTSTRTLRAVALLRRSAASVAAGAADAAAGYAWLRLALMLAFETLATFSYNIVYMYTSELFPTYTRNSVHSLCSAVGRLGSLLAPQMPLLISYWSGLPPLIFGVTSLASGALALLLPETARTPLPDTVADAERIGRPPVPSDDYLPLTQISDAKTNSKDNECNGTE
ncbi:hypothetical protein evm_014940 [Chilo suppressalis]|nr:hypothetical protein evm_014940 [Chilo suppressalis]